MSRSTAVLLLAAGVCLACAWALGGRALSLPGLYYDEVIQAQPALAFVEGDAPPAIPGMRAVRWWGGWWPWMTQPYMGALKSQLLVPVFAVGGADVALLRGTTLAWALLGLVLTMLWVRRLHGAPAAVLAGALLAVDPSLLFIGRHDWGSFSLGLLLRSASLLLLVAGWQRRAWPLLLLGGVCAGLGLYNKIDFAVFAAAAAVALLVARPAVVREVLGARWREGTAAATGALLGVAPLLVALGGALAAAGALQSAQGSGGDLGEKLAVTAAVLDGSYFQRLVLAGGRFEAMFDVEGATTSPAVLALVLAWTGLAARVVRARLAGGGADAETRAETFALLTLALTLLGLWLTPRAVRVHHTLNAWPFPQLVIALAAVRLWRTGTRAAPGRATGAGTRAAAVLLVVPVLLGAVRVDLATLATLRDTAGRGRWSDALARYLETLPPGMRLVSLDWGFDGPARFLDPDRPTRELVWALRRPRPPGLGVRVPGDAGDVYLMYLDAYAVFPYGAALEEALAGLPEDRFSVEILADREGHPVIRAVRFDAPHELVFRGERAQVRLR